MNTPGRPAGTRDDSSPSRPLRRGRPLHRLELAAGIVFGEDDTAPAALPPAPPGGPLQALADQIIPALARPPCVVSFSGGRDSSAVLAVATDVARREGLPDPIPVSWRFPGIASTEESDWQRLVVEHLGLAEWELITVEEELDLLGEVARGVLEAHGYLWPTNAYLHVPILQRAAAGSLLTGVDGDGLFGDWRWQRAQAVLHRRVRIERRDPLRIGLALAPAGLRRRRIRPSLVDVVPWLRPSVRTELAAAVCAYAAAEPRRWDRRLAYYAGHRMHRLAVHTFEVLGSAHGVEVTHPLLAPEFLAALARDGGSVGFGDRTAAMRALFGHLLPGATVSRATKGEFGRAIWRSQARSFANRWDGSGIDTDLIDPERLREAWRAPNPLFGSATLLQLAWLAGQKQ